jgi:hypothetical protein
METKAVLSGLRTSHVVDGQAPMGFPGSGHLRKGEKMVRACRWC